MAWVWFATGVLTGLLCLYWWNRAKEAERDVEELEGWLRFWQDNSVELSNRLMAMEQEAGVEDDVEDEPIAEYVGAEPNITDSARMFNFASEAFYYRWLAWNPRHD